MRNENAWRRSKFDFTDGVLSPVRRSNELSVASLLATSFTADFYRHAIPSHVRGRLLDLGCGKQPLYGLYRQYASEVIATDWPTSLHESSHIDVYSDINGLLPFRTSVFDTVLLSDVLEHVPQPSLAFAEISRILRPGGTLVLNTPFLYWIHEAPYDYCRHTRFSLERLAMANDFDVVELHELGGGLDVAIDIVSKCMLALPALGRPLAFLLQDAARRTRNWRIPRWLRGASSSRLPLAYGLVAIRR